MLSSTSSNHYIYVTCSSKDTANGCDITTIRYSSSSSEYWVSRYDEGNFAGEKKKERTRFSLMQVHSLLKSIFIVLLQIMANIMMFGK